jgi:hypothetical protein
MIRTPENNLHLINLLDNPLQSSTIVVRNIISIMKDEMSHIIIVCALVPYFSRGLDVI